MVAGLVHTSMALAASPVTGFISGQVVSSSGSSFVVRNSFGVSGDSTVKLGSSTSIVEQVTASRSDLKAGVCVVANGQRASSGAVDATRLTISAPVKGTCSNGFPGRGHGRGPGGARPAGNGPGGSGTGTIGSSANGPPPTFSRFGNFGFAAGTVTAVSGTTLTLHGTGGSSTVDLASSTELSQTKAVTAAAIKASRCARVTGTSSDNGLTVSATSVQLSQPDAQSGCGGFPGRP